MKKIIPIILTLTLLAFTCFGQKNNSSKFWIKQTTIDKVIDFEKSINNTIELLDMSVSLSESIYPLIKNYKIAKPVIIQRPQTGLLPLYAEYFYSEPDSIIRYISYDWEREKYGNFFKKQEIWKEESKKLKQYNTAYEEIKTSLIEQLGKPTTQDSKPKKTKSTSGRSDYLSRNTIWETDEYYSELDMIFESMTYRIRWNYYWKK